MKNLIVLPCMLLIATIACMAIMNTESNIDRKSEIEDSLSVSMRNTLKATSVNQMYEITEGEMSAELIRNLAENINTDGNFDVYINEANTEGLLDVKLKETHDNINGKESSSEIRKTLILEKLPTE